VLTPTAPSTAAGQHPVVERQWVSNTYSSNTNLLAPPGAAIRYRLYYVKIMAWTGTGYGYMVINGTQILAFCGTTPVPAVDWSDFKEAGLAANANSPLFVILSGLASVVAMALYTTETV
jgi:hypothetical protein